MIDIKRIETGELLYKIKKQFPTDVTTSAPCPVCGTGSRGGGICVGCIREEIIRRGVPPVTVDTLLFRLEQRRQFSFAVDDSCEAILKEIGK